MKTSGGFPVETKFLYDILYSVSGTDKFAICLDAEELDACLTPYTTEIFLLIKVLNMKVLAGGTDFQQLHRPVGNLKLVMLAVCSP